MFPGLPTLNFRPIITRHKHGMPGQELDLFKANLWRFLSECLVWNYAVAVRSTFHIKRHSESGRIPIMNHCGCCHITPDVHEINVALSQLMQFGRKERQFTAQEIWMPWEHIGRVNTSALCQGWSITCTCMAKWVQAHLLNHWKHYRKNWQPRQSNFFLDTQHKFGT